MSTNTLKTALLLGLLSAVLLVGGEAIWGSNGLYIGLAIAALMNFGSYFFSDKIALAMYGAQPVSETGNENPEVFRRVAPIVRNLCQRMGLPMPKLYIIPEDSPNAFANRARAGTCPAPRYFDQLGGRHAGRRDHHAGPHGPLVRPAPRR